MNTLIHASLVYDGGDQIYVPPQMGTPREDQLQGTPAEQLCELAGRCCYDSLGKGRPSFSKWVDPSLGFDDGSVEGYHEHILQVGHGSVLEHFNCTIEVQFEKKTNALFPLFNRPGLTIRNDAQQYARFTLNPRVIIDWDGMTNIDQRSDETWSNGWKQILSKLLHKLAPHIVPDLRKDDFWDFYGARIVEPTYETEAWISLFVSGSRGLSHELVRHGDFTAISQRSTRFVDESESDWVEHPLTTQYMVEHKYGDPPGRYFEQDAVREAKSAYGQTVATLEPWLIARGLDKTSARKQARGAARGYLGNALYTELIFSASVAQWKRMLRQRASVFADAEIRELFCKALVELKRSRYGERFESFELQDSPDGIGQVAIERKAE